MPYGHDKLQVTEPIMWEDKPPLKQFAPIICTSLLFEAVQFIFAIGASDITDIITNSLGGIIGETLDQADKYYKYNRIHPINIAYCCFAFG